MAPPRWVAVRYIAAFLLVLAASCSGSDSARQASGPLGAWTPLAKAPFAISPTAVWTGTRMLVWGPQAPHEARQGAFYGAGRGLSYDPATDRWTEIAPGPLGSRGGHSAIWAGDRMIVIGGRHDPFEDDLFDGAAYDPASDRWTSIAKAPLPIGAAVSALWTGSRLLVFAPGEGDPQPRPQGAAYDPASDRWTVMAKSPLRDPGGDEAFVWTGTRMIVWGGPPVADGASYDPSTDRWTAIAQAPMAARPQATAVWTGSRMIVWGGKTGREICTDSPSPPPGQPCQGPAIEEVQLLDGASYDPAEDRWTSIAAAPLDDRTHYNTAVWAGNRLIVCCGDGKDGPLPDGAAYDPQTNRWTPLAEAPLDPGSYDAVWSGSRLIVWGAGCVRVCNDDSFPSVAQGASFDPTVKD